MSKVARAALGAAVDYLMSPAARRWEIALLSGLGYAVAHAIQQSV